MFTREKELNTKRLDCAINAMALTALYVGEADGKFDKKERTMAVDTIVFSSHWNDFFYDDSNLDNERATTIRSMLHSKIDELSKEKLNHSDILLKLENLKKTALTLNKYGDLEKLKIDQLLDIVKKEKLKIKVNKYKNLKEINNEDRDSLIDEILQIIPEEFGDSLRKLLLTYSIFIALASGGFLAWRKINNKERTAIENINFAFGGTTFDKYSIGVAIEYVKSNWNIIKKSMNS